MNLVNSPVKDTVIPKLDLKLVFEGKRVFFYNPDTGVNSGIIFNLKDGFKAIISMRALVSDKPNYYYQKDLKGELSPEYDKKKNRKGNKDLTLYHKDYGYIRI